MLVSSPNILAFETSSPFLSVALKKGTHKIAETLLEGFMSHGENLVPLIRNLLKKKKLLFDDLDYCLIGRGPGSFTGLRVGFATLKGFLAAKKIACFGMLSLDIIAEGISLPEGSDLAICLDAFREKIYFRLYHREKGCWFPTSPAQVLSPAETGSLLTAGTYLAGNALRKNLHAAGVFSRAYGYFEVRKARAIVRRSNDRRAAMMNGLHFDPARSRRGFAAPAKGAKY